MFKILFLNLYPPDTQQGYLISSYVLKGFLRKYCRDKESMKIEVRNYSADTDIDVLADEIMSKEPDLVGLSSYVWNINTVRSLLAFVKHKVKSQFVVGGPEITDKWINSPEDAPLADYAIIGAGEYKLLHLVHYMRGFENRMPAGIAYWERGSLIYANGEKEIENLDIIPSIYLDSVIEDQYYANQEAYVETMRGCKYRCKYCVYHKNLDKVYYYSLDRVFKELTYLIAEKQVVSLRIFDSIFTMDLERAKLIVNHLLSLKNSGISLPYLIYWELMYNEIDEEFIYLTSQLKTKEKILNTYQPYYSDYPQHYSSLLENYTVVNCLGIQSLNNKALREVRRINIIPEKFEWFMKTVHKYNLVLKVDLILGLPFETLESYYEGLNYLLPYFENNDHILNIHRLQILPGSEMEEVCTRCNIEYAQYTPHYVLRTNEMSSEDMKIASKLTAVLFRIINSTLRPFIYWAVRNTGWDYITLVKYILAEIERDPDLQKTVIVSGEPDDIYWNEYIFQELPTKKIISYFKTLKDR